MSEQYNQMASVAGTHEGAESGSTPAVRVRLRSAWKARTRQYSLSRIPTTGAKVTSKIWRNPTKYERTPAAANRQPTTPHATVVTSRGSTTPRAELQKATTA